MDPFSAANGDPRPALRHYQYETPIWVSFGQEEITGIVFEVKRHTFIIEDSTCGHFREISLGSINEMSEVA